MSSEKIVGNVGIVVLDVVEFGFQVGAQDVDALEAFQQRLVGKLNGAHVDLERAFDAAAAGFAHAAPVFKRVGDQRIGRDGGNGLVPVLHFDRGERDVDHIAVGAAAGHFDPVADHHHIVDRELEAGDQAENGVLKNE